MHRSNSSLVWKRPEVSMRGTIVKQGTHAGIDPVGRNDVSRELGPVLAKDIAGGRIVDRVWGAAQIASPHRRCGDFAKKRSALDQAGAFETREVKQFVFFDRSADGPAVLIVDAYRSRQLAIRLPGIRLHVLVGVSFN